MNNMDLIIKIKEKMLILHEMGEVASLIGFINRWGNPWFGG